MRKEYGYIMKKDYAVGSYLHTNGHITTTYEVQASDAILISIASYSDEDMTIEVEIITKKDIENGNYQGVLYNINN